MDHLVVRTVHHLELFDQDGEIVSSNSPCAEGLLSNGADVSQHNVGIGEKLSIEEEEVCSPQSLASSMVVGIDAEIRKQRILVRNPGKDVSDDPYWRSNYNKTARYTFMKLHELSEHPCMHASIYIYISVARIYIYILHA